MNNKKISKNYKKLDPISHVLQRSGMYIGSTRIDTYEEFILNEKTNKFEKTSLQYSPGFIKIFDEIISNAVDESKRNNKLNKIEVNIQDNVISIKDNGGIPVIIHSEYKQYIPEFIFSDLRAGSNFDDETSRTVVGTYGVGAALTNIFSSKFIVETADGKNRFTQTYVKNISNKSNPEIKKSKSKYTKITYTPDYKRFNLKKLDINHIKMIEKRVYEIAACNTNLKVHFNGKLINFKTFKDFASMFILNDDVLFSQNDENWSICVSKAYDGNQVVSFVNTVETKTGGTHVDYIQNQIIDKLRVLIERKYKVKLKPSDIRNHLFLFVDSTIINPEFSSQTKEKLITNVKDFGVDIKISNRLINSIFKSDIVKSIIDWIEAKELIKQKQEVKKLNKKLDKIHVKGLIDAKEKNNRLDCELFIFEGLSALTGARKYRNPKLQGAFPLRGKVKNVYGLTNTKIIQNKELVNLMSAIGLKLNESVDIDNLRYGKIYFAVDADFDGISIAGLLINFFARHWKELFEQGRVYKVETPIIVAEKGKNKLNFYNLDDFNVWFDKNKNKNYKIEYKKGLGALTDDEYKEIIKAPKLTKLVLDDEYLKNLDIWFGNNPELRKNKLK